MPATTSSDYAEIAKGYADDSKEKLMPTTGTGQTKSELAGDHVWRALAKASFAIISHVTPAGQPRSSGVMYSMDDRRLFVVVAVDSWKARHIAADGRVAVTVPVRRGGILSLLFPIPPATVSFHGSATVHASDTPQAQRAIRRMGAVLPPERVATCAVIEIRPEGEFLTYGIGVPLMRMRDVAIARAHVSVA